MEALLEAMPIVLYFLGAVLLVVLIVLVIKLIGTVDRTNEVLDDIEKKTKSLNGLFDVIDTFTDTMSIISDSVVTTITSFLGHFRKGKKRKKENDYYE